MSEHKLQKIRTNFGFLFQGGALFDSLSVYENIIFPIQQHHKIKNYEQLDEIVKTKLTMVGMDGYQGYNPAELSGGQKKRVALARAIALSPEIILYDEPTTGLDPIRSDVINELILKLQKTLSITSIVVTHDMKSAYKIADRIIMLHNGRVVVDGKPEEIKNHSYTVVQQFINGQISEKDLKTIQLSSIGEEVAKLQ
ncbi:MAG: ATP-binding cassette domain-containing protein [Anaerohalosphaeraceae bacterium]|nr:ATP-binding cassette domain-containing protein [Anaerohalosphaeraceae bacterium]